MTFSALLRLRVILGVLIFALVYAQDWIERIPYRLGHAFAVLHGTAAVLTLAAAVIFTFSFVKLARGVDGSFCYDPTNPYWHAMRALYGSWWKPQMSLCKSYWLTVVMIFIPAMMTVLIGLFVIYTVPEIIRIWAWPSLSEIGFFFAIVCGVIAFVAGLVWLAAKFKWMATVGRVFFFALWLGMIFFAPSRAAYVAVERDGPALAIHKLIAQLPLFLAWFGILVAGVAVVSLVGYTLVKTFPLLQKTWLWQILAIVKDKMCPTLVACPCGQEPSE